MRLFVLFPLSGMLGESHIICGKGLLKYCLFFIFISSRLLHENISSPAIFWISMAFFYIIHNYLVFSLLHLPFSAPHHPTTHTLNCKLLRGSISLFVSSTSLSSLHAVGPQLILVNGAFPLRSISESELLLFNREMQRGPGLILRKLGKPNYLLEFRSIKFTNGLCCGVHLWVCCWEPWLNFLLETVICEAVVSPSQPTKAYLTHNVSKVRY